MSKMFMAVCYTEFVLISQSPMNTKLNHFTMQLFSKIHEHPFQKAVVALRTFLCSAVDLNALTRVGVYYKHVAFHYIQPRHVGLSYKLQFNTCLEMHRRIYLSWCILERKGNGAEAKSFLAMVHRTGTLLKN